MNDYRMLIYAILLIVMMIFNNSGAKKRLTEYFSAQKEKRTAKKAAGKGVTDMATLEVTGLGISFGGLRAVDDLTMSIEKGGLVG